ncbi:SDR family NAD(P)-dependent oxidoreductase [Maritalea sp.]|uniref:SDR family NAD(P)-dependent oxidoreductase n=1 Tax=Maritalea sp. TaxID=2003361 RepID=UPI003EF2E8D3
MPNLPQTPSFRLDGKSALVTGATSGIGLGCAAALAQAGANVTIAARKLDGLVNAQSDFAGDGLNVDILQIDVADVPSLKSAISQAPSFDILINSAGTARHGPALETDEADFDAVSNANVKGAYFITSAVAQKLVSAGKSGSLINISSQMGHVGGVDRAVYCATKHAVEGFTKSMAIEWGQHNIRVNTICPTFIKTPMAEQTLKDPARRAWVEEKIKLNRLGEIEDIMGAAVFLASDASALITGTSLLIDGGWTAD